MHISDIMSIKAEGLKPNSGIRLFGEFNGDFRFMQSIGALLKTD